MSEDTPNSEVKDLSKEMGLPTKEEPSIQAYSTSNMTTKYSRLACKAMRLLATQRREAEQQAKVDEFRRQVGDKEIADRVHKRAEDEARFERREEATTKALEIKKRLWKSSQNSGSGSDLHDSKWDLDPREWKPYDEPGESSWETAGIDCDQGHQAGLQPILQTFSTDPLEEAAFSEYWKSGWDEDGYDEASDYGHNDNQDYDYNYDHDFDYDYNGRSDNLETNEEVSILPEEGNENSPDLGLDLAAQNQHEQEEAAWPVPTWDVELRPRSKNNISQKSTVILDDKGTTLSHVSDSGTGAIHQPEKEKDGLFSLAEYATSNADSGQSPSGSRLNPPSPPISRAHNYGILGPELELAQLLLDKEWHNFMETWSTRNIQVEQPRFDRACAWFEHRQLRSEEVRESEELDRAHKVRSNTVFNVVLAQEAAQSRQHCHSQGASRPRLECPCQPKDLAEYKEEVKGATREGYSGNLVGCPWNRSRDKSSCVSSGCRYHHSRLSEVSKPESGDKL